MDLPGWVVLPDLHVGEHQEVPEQPGNVGQGEAEEEVLVDGDPGAGEAGEEAEDGEGKEEEGGGDGEAGELQVVQVGVVVQLLLYNIHV